MRERSILAAALVTMFSLTAGAQSSARSSSKTTPPPADWVEKWTGNTWLNAAGAPHSDALHLVERYRLVGGGQYLEARVTAEDPKVLTKPYTYTRYYQKTNKEIPQYVCTDDLVTPDIPDID